VISRHACAAFINEHRAVIVHTLALVAVLCMILSAYWFQPQPASLVRYRPTPGPKDYYDPRGPWYFLGGTLALVAALALARNPIPSPRHAGGKLSHLSPQWAWVLVAPGTLLLLAAAEINGQMIGAFDGLWHASPHVQFVLLIAGIALLVGGFGGLPVFPLRRGRTGPTRQGVQRPAVGEGCSPTASDTGPAQDAVSSIPIHARIRGEVFLVVAFTLVALGVRLFQLESSLRTMIDETHFAFGVTYFWSFPDVNLFEPMPTTASFPFIFSYGEYGLVTLLGRNFLGLRALSAILGALTIPATYSLARELFDRRTAILAALVLLTFPPHVHYSRLALNNIADPLFGTLAVALLARALRTRHRMDYVLAGVMLGAAQYFYEGGRILFPALVVAWMGIGWVLWRPRPSIRGLILTGLVFVIIALPVYYTLAGLHFPLFDRINKAELDDYYWARGRESNNWQARVARFRHSLLHYVNAPENTLFHFYLYYGGAHPLLLVYVIPPFLLGLVIAAWQWRKPGALLVIWLLATSAGNALLLESAVSARYVLAFPAVAILVALGIRGTLPMIWPASWPVCRQTALMIALAAIMAVGQGLYYFGTHLDHFEAEVRQQVDHDVEDALLRSAGFSPGTEVWLIGEGRMMVEIDAQRIANFFADDLVIVESLPFYVSAAELARLPRDRNLAFFFAPNDRRTLDKLLAVFGPRELQHTPYSDVPPEKAFVLFYVPADVHPPTLPEAYG
jgi:4-amino-4-deoxy-L-arabinose transferase-like glycosyltransferase